MPKLTKEQLKQIEDYIKSLPEEEREAKLKEVIKQFEEAPAQCPFCLMSEGKIQTTKVYENESFLAVLEINPINKGHTILFPKRHIKSLAQLNTDEAEQIGKILKKLVHALLPISQSMNTVISEGGESGQRFEHLVMNVIPRHKGDSFEIKWQAGEAKPEELEKTKEQIVKNYPQVEKPKSQPVDNESLKSEFSKLKKRLP